MVFKTPSFMHKDHFIGIGIFIKIILHAFLRCCQYNMAIIVHQYRFSALQVIFFRLDLETLQNCGASAFFLRQFPEPL